MRIIHILTANRAEEGLLKPIESELAKLGVGVITTKIMEGKLHPEMFEWLDMTWKDIRPDIVVVPCDREEMVYPAAYAFHRGHIVCHFHAGNLGSDHPDEMNRRAISCFSHILLCNTEEDKKNLVRLGEEEWRCYVVGSTAFDDIKYDYSLCPNYPYAMVLLHPDPDPEKTRKDLEEAIAAVQDYIGLVWLAPNHDPNHEIIRNFLADPQIKGKAFPKAWQVNIELQNLQRETFLGLLQKCSLFVGNSSVVQYEAPFFGVKTLNIGERNKNRKPIQVVSGGSKKIAELLANITINEKLRRKRFKLDTLL